MASSILEALLGANQEAQAENPYAQYSGIANQVSADLQDQRVVQQYGLKDTAIASLLSGLVGGGLQQLGTNYTDKQSNLYQQALLGGIGGEMTMPQGINQNLFRKASEQAKLFKIQKVLQDSTDKAELDKLFKTTKAKTKAEKQGELEAYNDDLGIDETGTPTKKNPLNPIVKAETEAAEKLREQAKTLRNEIANTPEYKQYSLIQPSMAALAKLAKDDTRASDLPFIYELVKVLDPGSVVREGEIALASGTNSTLNKYLNELTSATTGTSKLSPQTKMELLANVGNKYKAVQKQYETVAQPRLDIASKYGIALDEVLTLPFANKPTTTAITAPAATAPTQDVRAAALAELARRGVKF